MSRIRNESSINNDDMVSKLRSAIEHRATWMGLMCVEAEKAGADWESIARKAVKQTGCFHGDRIIENMNGTEGLVLFTEAFLPELTKKLFEMDIKELNDDKLYVEFNYCPLVSAWQKLGIGDDRIETLCDIAMDGDRGIAEEVGFDFELGNTIAKGNKVCEVCFKKKQH